MLLFHEDAIFFVLTQVVLSKMLNVLRVDQVLLFGVLVVELFEMVDFIFILVVTMMARTHLRVRQLLALPDALQPIVPCDQARAGYIEDLEDIHHKLILFVC